jgi:hypothetical protein
VRPEDGRQELQARQQEVGNQLRRAVDPAHPVAPAPGAAPPAKGSPAPEGAARSSETKAPGPGADQATKGLPAPQGKPQPSESDLRAEPPQAQITSPQAATSPYTTQPPRDDSSATRRAEPPRTQAGPTRAAREYAPDASRTAQPGAVNSQPPKAPEPTTRHEVAPGPTARAGIGQPGAQDPRIQKREPVPQGNTPSAERAAPAPSAASRGTPGAPAAGPTARAHTPNDHSAPAVQPRDQQPNQKSSAGQNNATDPKNLKGQDGSPSGAGGKGP